MKGDVLLQMTEGVALGDVDATGIRVVFTNQKVKQGGLATSIAPGDSDAFAWTDLKRDIMEQLLQSKGFGEILKLDHRPNLARY